MAEEESHQPVFINRAESAAKDLESYYIGPRSQIAFREPIVAEPVTDDEAIEELNCLADQIRSGAVFTHVQVAKVLRVLGDKFTERGGTSPGINTAALKVEDAILHHDAVFGQAN